MHSEQLSVRALRTLNRLGDIMIPADQDFPSFSELGCIEHIDGVIRHAPEDDIGDLGTLLAVLSLLPTFILRLFVHSTENARGKKGPIAPTFRLLNVALRGILFTLYYSGKHGSAYTGQTPLDIIGFELTCVPKD